MEILAKELNPTKTDKFLDSIAVCCGAVEEDNDDFAEFHEELKLWRIPTAETAETQTLDESMSHQPLNDEETIPSLDSFSVSIPRIIRVEPEDEEEVQSEIRSQIFVHTIRRDEKNEEEEKTKAASVASKMKLHVIQENVATVGHKMKSVWIPVAKSKLEKTNIELKRNLNEWQLVAVVRHQQVKALWLQKKSVWIPLIRSHMTNVRQNMKSAVMEHKALWIPAIKKNMDKIRIASMGNMDKLRSLSIKSMKNLRVASVSHKTKFLLIQEKSVKKMQKIALKYNLIAGQRRKRLPRPSVMAALTQQMKSTKITGNKYSRSSRPLGMEIEVSNSHTNHRGFELDLNKLPIRTYEMDSC